MNIFNRLNTSIILILLGVGIATAAISAYLNHGITGEWFSGFLQNFATEAFGAVATYFLIDLIGTRLNTDVRKQQLISELGSFNNERAVEAIREMWYEGWLQDNSVCGARLRYANLQGADLGLCDLREVDFYRSNLRGAIMWADLRGANLIDADIKEAQFVRPENNPFPPIYPKMAQGFGSEYPKHALFDKNTILPDGSKWSEKEGYDLARFTNSNHEEFWRSSRWQSPAYKDAEEAYRQAYSSATYMDVKRLEEKIDTLLDN